MICGRTIVKGTPALYGPGRWGDLSNRNLYVQCENIRLPREAAEHRAANLTFISGPLRAAPKAKV
jgi:hypothetical protein